MFPVKMSSRIMKENICRKQKYGHTFTSICHIFKCFKCHFGSLTCSLHKITKLTVIGQIRKYLSLVDNNNPEEELNNGIHELKTRVLPEH